MPPKSKITSAGSGAAGTHTGRSATSNTNLVALYKAVYTGLHDDEPDYEQALDAIERLLYLDANNLKVKLCKCILLIQTNAFEQVDQVVKTSEVDELYRLLSEEKSGDQSRGLQAKRQQQATALQFQLTPAQRAEFAKLLLVAKAYALYRRNLVDQALEILNNVASRVAEPDMTLDNLVVQTLYKQGSFTAASEAFAQLLTKYADQGLESDPEYIVNAMAINIMANHADKALSLVQPILKTMTKHRLASNAAIKARLDRTRESDRSSVLDTLRREQLSELLAVAGEVDAKEDGSYPVVDADVAEDDVVSTHADAWLNTGLALLELNRPREALVAIRCARRLIILDAMERIREADPEAYSGTLPASAIAKHDSAAASEFWMLMTAEAYALQRLVSEPSATSSYSNYSPALQELLAAYDADLSFYLSDRDQTKLRDTVKELYTKVANTEGANLQAQAVAINNVAALRGNAADKPAEMLKKLEAAVAAAGDRLTPAQVRGVRLNTCLLLAHARKFQECKDLLLKLSRSLRETSSKGEFSVLMNAFVAVKEKAYDQADAFLAAHIESHPKSSMLSQLTQIHLCLLKENYAGALAKLEAFVEDGKVASAQFPNIRHAPAVTALRVAFLERMGDADGAIKLLESEMEYLKTHPQEAKVFGSNVISAMREHIVELYLRSGKSVLAISYLRELVNSADVAGQIGKKRKYLARLILALADSNPEAAAEHFSTLEQLAGGEAKSATGSAILTPAHLNDLETQSISALKAGASIVVSSEAKRDGAEAAQAADAAPQGKVRGADGRPKYSPEKLEAVRRRKKQRRIRHVPEAVRRELAAAGVRIRKTATVKKLHEAIDKVVRQEAQKAETANLAASAAIAPERKEQGKGKGAQKASSAAPLTLAQRLTPNPTRWRPKWERGGSTKRGELARGPQGSGVSDTAKVEVSVTPSAQKPAAQKPAVKSAPKGGRRR